MDVVVVCVCVEGGDPNTSSAVVRPNVFSAVVLGGRVTTAALPWC
jgi:hypothetical protein